SKRSKRKRT
nr:Chain E, Inner membrane protein ALBINO3, chloroplastic [Arabidopsis thaliana]5E4W_F Chain F, Inner membrane protein ALBINO3, chloroplastic [Arabidopsis thaliana]